MSHRPTSRRTGRRGGAFTLVELLATLTLVCIILPVATQGILLCLDTAAHARHRTEAAALAQSKMAELIATGQWYDAELQGDFGDDWPQYTWISQTGDWEDSRLAQLDVYVLWTRRGRDYHVTLSTLLYAGVPNE